MTRITEELRDRIRSPRDDALTTIALHEVSGERITPAITAAIPSTAQELSPPHGRTGARMAPMAAPIIRIGARMPPLY